MFITEIISDTGRQRDHNEDCAWISTYIENLQNSQHSPQIEINTDILHLNEEKTGTMRFEKDPPLFSIMLDEHDIARTPKTADAYDILKDMLIIGVADGMGGHRAGEVASGIVAMTLPAIFTWDTIKNPDAERENILAGSIKKMIKGISERANMPEYQGMGTTLVTAIIKDDEVTLANIGDSRAYLHNDKGLKQVTKDHSFVQSLIDAGAIDEEEAFDHPQKNVISKSIGKNPDVEAEIYSICIEESDTLLLCSDGLNDMLRREEIEEIMNGNEGLHEIAKKLLDEANERGGKDNITIALARR